MPSKPGFTSERTGDAIRLLLNGDWSLSSGDAMEQSANALLAAAVAARQAILDLSGVGRLDTAGAWLIDRTSKMLAAAGVKSELANLRADQAVLLREAEWRKFDPPRSKPHSGIIDLLAALGKQIVSVCKDFTSGIAFLGEAVVATSASLLDPRRFRLTALVSQIENFGLRSTPIIVLINFLVGCIVAQQGIFQLRVFGAQTFAVDLIGILILRELGVLLTSIMVAGRSGSAITAELGSMKMREEIDALNVMGLSPMEVLVVPRLLALIISLPLLTFIADMAAIFGGMVVTWVYAGVSPEAFLFRLQSAISLHTFLVGMIKAPFMAAVIALIAAREGLAVEGSSESLGRQVTASVVKSIFMVIVVDGLFAIFFASINY